MNTLRETSLRTFESLRKLTEKNHSGLNFCVSFVSLVLGLERKPRADEESE